MHIKGRQQIVSCYDVGERNVLAILSKPDPVTVEAFDTDQADARMEPVVQDLILLLDSYDLPV